MSKTTLPKELEQRFDELVHYIKNIPVGQYNQNGVNIGYKKADDVIKDFIATALAQAEERVKQQVLELIGSDDPTHYKEVSSETRRYNEIRNELRQQLREKVSSL